MTDLLGADLVEKPIQAVEYKITIAAGAPTAVRRGDMIRITGAVKNLGRDLAGFAKPDQPLRVGAELLYGDERKKIVSARSVIEVSVLETNGDVPFSFELNTSHCQAGEYVVLIDLVYDGLAWLRRHGGSPAYHTVSISPGMSFDIVDEAVPVEDARFWQQHVVELSPSAGFGLSSPSFQTYALETSKGPVMARSMLTEYELALLYAMARHHYKGIGKIVDLGPLIGVGTYALASGLRENFAAPEAKKIYSYDLFLYSNMGHFLPVSDSGGTGSVFHRFLEINRDSLDIITPVPGDFLNMSWTGEPIEILFIDLAKSWDLNSHVVRTFFPSLIPGHSIVLQQDYVHAGEPWVALTMEMLSEYFEPLYLVYGATAAYRLTKAIPADILRQNPRDLPLARIDELFERARGRATPAVAEVLKCCQASVRLDKGDIKGSRELLDDVDLRARDGNDASQEFAPTISGSLAAVRRLIERAQPKV